MITLHIYQGQCHPTIKNLLVHLSIVFPVAMSLKRENTSPVRVDAPFVKVVALKRPGIGYIRENQLYK